MKKICVLLILIAGMCMGIACKKQNNKPPDLGAGATDGQEAVLVSGTEEKEKGMLDTLFDRGNYWNEIPVTYTYHFTGTIDGKYKFDLYLVVDSTTVNGWYRYLNQDSFISIEGTLAGENLKIKEDGGHTFEGKFDYAAGRISGNWTSADGKRILPFEMENPYGLGYPHLSYKVHLEKEKHNRYFVRYIQVTTSEGETHELATNTEAYDFAYGLHVQDYNFDGYPDISLVELLPAYPPLKFKYFLYLPEEDYYNETDMYKDLYTLVDFVDFRNKTVSLLIEGRHYSQSVYKYQDERLFLIYNEYYSNHPAEEDSKMMYGYFKIENGESVEIDEEEYKQIYGTRGD